MWFIGKLTFSAGLEQAARGEGQDRRHVRPRAGRQADRLDPQGGRREGDQPQEHQDKVEVGGREPFLRRPWSDLSSALYFA